MTAGSCRRARERACGFLWVSVSFYGFLWVSVGFYGFLWVSMGYNVLLWVSITVRFMR